MSLSCAEIIDEIQARVGRPGTTVLVDTTWLTRRINEGQKTLIEAVPLIPSVSFKNTTSLDTTGAILYALNDLTIGDNTLCRPCHITDVWYLDGHDSRQLTFVPQDEFDAQHPDPTHSDEHFEKPAQWTLRGNTYIELYPYCASAYWNKNLRVDGDYYPKDFSTDSTLASDISRADEGLILYGVWRAWEAIVVNPVATERARKAFSNPHPAPTERLGWMEEFKDKTETMIAWSGDLYDGVIN